MRRSYTRRGGKAPGAKPSSSVDWMRVKGSKMPPASAQVEDFRPGHISPKNARDQAVAAMADFIGREAVSTGTRVGMGVAYDALNEEARARTPKTRTRRRRRR